VRQRAHLDHGRGRAADAEELVADDAKVHAAAHVGHVGGDLDHVLERSPGVLDQRLHRAEHLAGLSHEVADVVDGAVGGVGYLAGQEQDGLGAGDLDGLAVARRVVDSGRAVLSMVAMSPPVSVTPPKCRESTSRGEGGRGSYDA
jgi:hypothetical protein